MDDFFTIALPGYLTGIGTLVLAFTTYWTVRRAERERRAAEERRAALNASRVQLDDLSLNGEGASAIAETRLCNFSDEPAGSVRVTWRISDVDVKPRTEVQELGRVVSGACVDLSLPVRLRQGLIIRAYCSFSMDDRHWQLDAQNGHLLEYQVTSPGGAPVIFREIQIYRSDGTSDSFMWGKPVERLRDPLDGQQAKSPDPKNIQ